MAKKVYVGEKGVARQVKAIYLGVNGVARKVKNAYIGVANVARRCFPSAIRWKKYNCVTTVIDGHYEEKTGSSSMKFSYSLATSVLFYDSYEFSSSSGYSGVDGTEYSLPDELSAIVGKYYIRTNGLNKLVYKVDSFTYNSDSDFYWEGSGVARCEWVSKETHYTRGSDYYGTFDVEEGALPEEGELIVGSVEADFCVLLIDGNYYYYYEEE